MNHREINLQEVYNKIKNTFRNLTETPDFEAQQILRQLFGASYSEILMGVRRSASEEQLNQLQNIVSRRCHHYPLQYLLGEWDFFGRSFLVGEGVLIPRADTEVLVEECLRFLAGRTAPRVLDLCSGTGCIGVTIGLEIPDARVTAVEKSAEAFDYLQKNNQRLHAGVECLLGDAREVPEGVEAYDLVVSNPPYLTEEDMSQLQQEVRHEPAEALYGESDGLYFYRCLTQRYAPRLRTGGMLAYEIGVGQQEAVSELLAAASLKSICQIKDYNGIIRCVTGKKL